MDPEMRAFKRLARDDDASRGRNARARPASEGRRVSMADVAARAGVSGQTVSRVVNGSPRVDPQTRARVETAMAALGYRPHRAARALRTGRSGTIGVVAATLATVGNFRMLQAVSDAAALRGYALALVMATERASLADAFEQLTDQGVDGAIVLNEATALARDAEAPPHLHLVVVDSPPDPRFGVVDSDHAGGAFAATRHLLASGHDTVWHVAGPAGSFAADERERGWREALAEAGAAQPEAIRGDWSASSGHRAAAALAPDASAVFAANDQMALGLLRALADSGRRIPEDIAVVGFDDVPDAAEFRPPLTTVRQDFPALGERAVLALIAAIDGAPASAHVTPTTLIVRDSAP